MEQGYFEVTRLGVRVTEQLLQERNSTWKENKNLKLEVEELESLLGPDDSDVDFRRILQEARDEKRLRDIGDGPSEFLVGSVVRDR